MKEIAARQFNLLMIKADMISDSCVQNAKEKYCLIFQNTVHKVHCKK